MMPMYTLNLNRPNQKRKKTKLSLYSFLLFRYIHELKRELVDSVYEAMLSGLLTYQNMMTTVAQKTLSWTPFATNLWI